MPYADKAKQREAQREWYRKKYAKDETFRLVEAVRKADWYSDPEKKALNTATKRAWRKLAK